MGTKVRSKKFSVSFAGLVIPIALVVAICIYMFVMGAPQNFAGNNNANHPLPGNYFGMVYKGGVIVPILMSLFLIVVTVSIERFIAIRKAKGKRNISVFVREIQLLLTKSKIEEARALCAKQKGSVANVVESALAKYNEVEVDDTLSKEQKILAIQKEIEEATMLELPGMEQNLSIIATISSVGTLIALLGTVLGMIKAFAALANAGAPDSIALATGISEALINTALGIATSAIAVIMYNVFTTGIDKITYSIDEAGFSIVQSYAANHK